MGLPVAVTASLMLSSMLGFRFEAMSDGKWNHHILFEPIKPSDMRPMRPVTRPPPMFSTTNNTPTNASLGNSSTTTETVMAAVVPSQKPVNVGSLEVSEIPCGPAKCGSAEICVSWVKVRNEKSRRSRESPLMSHQCLVDDGTHYNKMDPEGIQLCDKGQIVVIIKTDQSCLRDKPPCPLVWNFNCIPETEAGIGAKVHSCKLKKCPGECVEEVNCELEPPCYTKAECTEFGRSLSRFSDPSIFRGRSS